MTDAMYLGRDAQGGATYALEPEKLRTHGVVVGMTGSGKTGMALVMLEELVHAGVPVIAIDPKGDLGNLLLTFPSLDAASFRPWIDEAEAARRGHTPCAHAHAVADRWRAGLANRERVGMQRIAFETDYPHADSTFPNTRQVATGICEKAGLSDGEIYLLMRGNAIPPSQPDRFGLVR